MIDLKKPFLVQRAKVQPYTEGMRVSEMLRLDYMGSAEFEWGAVPKCLRAMAARDLVVTRTYVKCKEVFIICTKEEGFELRDFLAVLAEDILVLKERISFSQRFANAPVARYDHGEDFWFDIDLHVAWTLDEAAANHFIDALKVSVEYMDSQKREKSEMKVKIKIPKGAAETQPIEHIYECPIAVQLNSKLKKVYYARVFETYITIIRRGLDTSGSCCVNIPDSKGTIEFLGSPEAAKGFSLELDIPEEYLKQGSKLTNALHTIMGKSA